LLAKTPGVVALLALTRLEGTHRSELAASSLRQSGETCLAASGAHAAPPGVVITLGKGSRGRLDPHAAGAYPGLVTRLSTMVLLAWLAAGCGSEESNSTPQACAPNASVSCTGPGTCAGFQVCKADGSGYSACDCSGSGGSGGSSGAAGSGGASGVCPKGLKGPELVELKSPNGTRYCMDATEVTFAQYDEFLAAKVDNSKFAEPCQWAALEYNDPTFPDCLSGVAKSDDAPARCVDWCPAREYCNWAGKRLCGRIGGGPVSSKGTGPQDANVSQWYNACSAGGAQEFAYGTTEKPECTASLSNIGSVKTPDGCQSNVAEIFGLSSNAAEWEDGCEPEPGPCPSIARPTSSLSPTCKDWEHSAKSRFIGFRCCHDGVNP